MLDIKNLQVYSWYLKGARDMLLYLSNANMLNISPKRLEIGKQYSTAAESKFINYQFVKQMLTDKHFLDEVLSGVDEFKLKWGTDGKYKTVKLIPD